ncbi:Cytoplasmic tRNA 2-thiolation protein 2 [Debaryomyces fabryi]|uniref:Cytoplasmic tRNA 2-thiolation protein 2 n=1 Tax=Debaryomyces fabryi TaxID=58627 RepID=A0A0V1Q694_9ASCO|nr:Cytoplasmic tRNA 2-thiolation protein 2 [Debaryomyces fabryi]KSA04008.1 Cytoplasmic tRNA 2-thiolation protein 2 [Debaryomyces fabryi]CUM53749.1 unnamed protein product [Debaryomyces fabryi]
MSQPIQYLDISENIPCQRCKTETAVLVSRKEKFCKGCFLRFIRGKQRKQMQDEKYKVKYGKNEQNAPKQKVLLTLSCGISSLVLVDVMASLLKEQYDMHKGKQGFELVVLNIDEYELKALDRSTKDVLKQLVECFKPINFTYKILSLESYVLDQSLLEKIVLNGDFTAYSQYINHDKKYTLSELLSLCPNKSSLEDLLTIIYDELILRTAYLESCETILYGHSMTRIANEIIALTVKGRGSSIYQTVSDHTVKFRNKDFKIMFPLRDVLFAEILAYSKLSELDKFAVESTKPVSKITKNMTIRDLTTNYFNQLDATGYASTASTVVKTGDKLGAPKFEEESSICQVCGTEIHQDPKDWLRRITVNKSAPLETEEEKEYAEQYKKASSLIEESNGSQHKTPINICYGCTVTISGIKNESGFIWPIKNTENDEEREILNEYILTDDEDDE